MSMNDLLTDAEVETIVLALQHLQTGEPGHDEVIEGILQKLP